MWLAFRTLRILSFLLLPSVCLAEEMSVVSAHGGRVSVIADFPKGEGPFPALVLAPGIGYHMNLPALEETARALVGQGIAVFRFNWAYFTAQPQGQPSENHAKEVQDLQAVLAAARRHPKVLDKNISVGGKSLGSLVAWRVFAAEPSLRSGLFLTPLCGSAPKGGTAQRSEAQQNYPGFETERRPTLFIAGSSDPLCAVPALYQLAASGTGAARIAVVEGDHGYENPALAPPAAEAARQRNVAAVAALAAGFGAAEMTGERGKAGDTPAGLHPEGRRVRPGASLRNVCACREPGTSFGDVVLVGQRRRVR